jgi:hypothetical protein
MGKTKISETNYATLGKPMSEEELVKMIKDAENSKFHSMEDLNKKISEWKLKFGK